MYTGGELGSTIVGGSGAESEIAYATLHSLSSVEDHSNLTTTPLLLPFGNSRFGLRYAESVGTQRDNDVSATALVLLEDWETAQFAQSLSVRTVTERLTSVRQMAQWCGVAPHLASDREVTRWLAKGGTWSASTRHTYYTRLNAWFSWLVSTGRRADNPMSAMKAPKRPKNLPRPPADEHLPTLLAHANRRRTRAMLLLALCQGLRAMEIAKFRGDDIDLVTGEVTVTGKGGKTAMIPLHQRIRELAPSMPPGWWFPSPSAPGKPVSRKSVSATLSGVFHRSGIAGTGHSARHWYGTALIESDVDLLTTKELLRHESVASTQIYVKVSNQRKHKGIDRIDPLTAGTRRAKRRAKGDNHAA